MSSVAFIIFSVIVNAMMLLGGYYLGLRRRKAEQRGIRHLRREVEIGRRMAARLVATEGELRIAQARARGIERELEGARRELIEAHQEVNAALQAAVTRRQLERRMEVRRTFRLPVEAGQVEPRSTDFEGALKEVTLAYGTREGATVLGQADTFPFRLCLSAAIQSLWTGQIVVTAAQGAGQGEVVFVQGMIGWAVCKTQQENLGTFLFRIGRVNKEDLQRARDLYDDHGGKKKLGALLEEQGLIQRPVLRRCLMLHARKALSLLLSDENAIGRCTAIPVPPDERYLFFPEEVLPLSVLADVVEASPAHQVQAQRWKQLGKDNAVLGQLAALKDYLASAVVTWEGQVVTAHLDPERINPYLLSVLVAGLVEASNRAAFQGNIGQLETLTIECSEGCLVAKWIDEDMSYLSLVLLARADNAPAAKAELQRGRQGLQEWLHHQGYFSEGRGAAAVQVPDSP